MMRDGEPGAWRSLAVPGLAPLWRAVHARLCSGQHVVRVRLPELSEEQRNALADLLGLDRLPPVRPVVNLDRVEQVVLETTGVPLQQALTRLVGPLEDRALRRAEDTAAREELWTWLESHDVVRGQPALGEWVRAVRQTGLVGGSVRRTQRELDRALRVLAQLPAPGDPLPKFADRVLGDPHALDDGTRSAGLVLRALAGVYSVPDPPDTAGRRALWRRAGVADDELSSTVLLAGLVLSGDGPVETVLRTCARAGQASALTLAQVRSLHLPAGHERDLWIVENPTILALALARFGKCCPPLVCTSGWPSAAGTLLLERLTEGGLRLHYHGDFDGEGVRIAAHIMARTGAVPWRMSAADYEQALGDLSTADGPSVGRVSDAPWDADLAPALCEYGTAVPEERVADVLLKDLEELRTTS